MNKKIINQVLNRKFKNWKDSIKDENVKKLVEQNTIITGGCIASMLLKEKVNDFDLYFTNKETVLAVSKYYVNIFNKIKKGKIATIEEDDTGRISIYIKSKGVASLDENYFQKISEEFQIEEILDNSENKKDINQKKPEEKEPYQPVFLSSNAITLSNKIQLVIRFYGDAKVIHTNYDFIHCTNYWTSSDHKLYLNQEALESILSKQLKYVGSKYPVCSVIRTRKFIERGWHINAGQYLKMLFQVSQLDLTNIDILEDQLVGVDSTYFSMLITGLKNKTKNDENFEIDYSYISTIIDKIF
jgi:hypothetical protein